MWLFIDLIKFVDLVGVGCEDVCCCPIDPSTDLSSLFYLGESTGNNVPPTSPSL